MRTDESSRLSVASLEIEARADRDEIRRFKAEVEELERERSFAQKDADRDWVRVEELKAQLRQAGVRIDILRRDLDALIKERDRMRRYVEAAEAKLVEVQSTDFSDLLYRATNAEAGLAEAKKEIQQRREEFEMVCQARYKAEAKLFEAQTDRMKYKAEVARLRRALTIQRGMAVPLSAEAIDELLAPEVKP